MMRIAVCVKQVPVVSALQFDAETKTLKREGVPSEISSFDVRALIRAVDLKIEHGGEVVAFTMGPPQARTALEQCLALGADRAVHLCDRAFAGSDTLATARALALALRREPFDIVLCGRNSVDAETGQVGPEVAELLDLPQITGARTLAIDPQQRQVSAERETDDGFETHLAPLPVVITAAEDLAPERFPSKADREAAKGKPIVELRAADLATDPTQFGFLGSPTEVAGLEFVATARTQRIVEGSSVDDAAATLARILVEEHGLFGAWKVRSQPALASLAPQTVHRAPPEIWVLAEVLGGVLRPVTSELLGKASEIGRHLGAPVSAVLLGHDVERHIAGLAAYGADRVLLGNDPRLAPFQTEVHAGIVSMAIRQRQPGIVLMPATTRGRDLAPRVAARLQLGLTGDCIDIGLDNRGRLLQYKPAFGGSVVAPIVSRTTPQMATLRPGMLAAPRADHSRTAVIDVCPLEGIGEPRTRIVDSTPVAAQAVELDQAEIVIGIGKGLGQKENIATVQPLVDLLGAAICTTRDVTDAGWFPKQYQVGLTGRAIAPQLYVGIGIRGAFEHTVGIRRAGLVVAINKNPKALIFKSCDYGIVGDYAEVVPALYRHLAAASAASPAPRRP
jgi:electron transfer flavoprotein alpha subunit